MCLSFLANPDPTSLAPQIDPARYAGTLQEVRHIWQLRANTAEETAAEIERRDRSAKLFPQLYTNLAGGTLEIREATNHNLLNPHPASCTTRTGTTWRNSREPVIDVSVLEDYLVERPRANGTQPYFDPAIIDFISNGFPPGQEHHNTFTVNSNSSTADKFAQDLDKLLEADLAAKKVARVGPVTDFKHLLQEQGFDRGYISSVSAFDKNAPATSPTFPMQLRNQRWTKQRRDLALKLTKAPKIRKIDDASQPDKGGKRPVKSGVKSVNARCIHNAKIQYSQLKEAILAFRALADKKGPAANLQAFKVDHSESYKHLTNSLALTSMLCFIHRGIVYRNLILPFGYRPAAGYYQRFSSAIQWIVLTTKPTTPDGKTIDFEALTLLDDSMYVAEARDIHHVKEVVIRIHKELNVTRNESKDKEEGQPSHIVIWYGILFDLRKSTMSLPERKRLEYSLKVLNALDSRALSRLELEKLIGVLQWSSVVVVPGRAFLFHLRTMLRNSNLRYNYITDLAREELEFWREVLTAESFRTRPALINSTNLKERIAIGQDAATSKGAGGALLIGKRLYIWSYMFTETQLIRPGFSKQIGSMEFWAIYTSVLVFEQFVSDKHIDVHTDSSSSDWVVNRVSSRRDIVTAHLLQHLMIKVAHINSSISSTHVSGDSNIIPDMASRQGAEAVISYMKKYRPDISVHVLQVPQTAKDTLNRALALR